MARIGLIWGHALLQQKCVSPDIHGILPSKMCANLLLWVTWLKYKGSYFLDDGPDQKKLTKIGQPVGQNSTRSSGERVTCPPCSSDGVGEISEVSPELEPAPKAPFKPLV